MDLDNIVWGTAMELDNIVWGTTSGLVDNIVWGTAAEGEDITWGSNDEDAVLFDDPSADPVIYDPGIWEEMPVVPIGSPEGGGGYLPGVVTYLPTLGGL